MARYLHHRNGTFYLRRRIAGYPQNSAHLMVSLACKNKTQALYLLSRLEMEYQKMLDSFVTLHPPLPETLARCYLKISLHQLVDKFQRNMRMAKMSGRFGEDTLMRLELQKTVLRTLLLHGLQEQFPVQAIDPDWTPNTLECVLHLYSLELDHLQSTEGREMLQREFRQATGTTIDILTSLEHECQIRECYLQAKLAACETAQDGTHATLKSTLDYAKDLFIARPLSGDQPTELSAHDETQIPSKVAAAEPRNDPRSTPATPHVVTAKDLTINDLRAMYDTASNAKTSTGEQYTSDIASVYTRFVTVNEIGSGMAAQRASDLRLFSFVTGILDVRDIRQFHLSQYRDALKSIPKNFLRSQKDADLTIDEIMARSRLMDKTEIGLATSTMKRHFKSLELLINRAKSEGHMVSDTLDIAGLKSKQTAKGPAHKKRAVYKFSELQRVFSHPAWQGFKGKRRHISGTTLIKDSRYWVPLILAYTGARRAEIAGLMRNDIETINGIPCFHIRANKYRTIKGENGDIEKNRIIPVHPHLLELGILNHVQNSPKSATGLMFPDILPKPRNKASKRTPSDILKIGETLDDFWRKSLQISLDGNPRKLCMHSLRHYVNNALIHSQDVHEVTRYDLLGHVESGPSEQNVNTNTYRDDTEVAHKFAAISKLPHLF